MTDHPGQSSDRSQDASITLRVYAHWLPDASTDKFVDALDDATPDGPQTAPRVSSDDDQMPLVQW